VVGIGVFKIVYGSYARLTNTFGKIVGCTEYHEYSRSVSSGHGICPSHPFVGFFSRLCSHPAIALSLDNSGGDALNPFRERFRLAREKPYETLRLGTVRVSPFLVT
jgi:hypothetical protein